MASAVLWAPKWRESFELELYNLYRADPKQLTVIVHDETSLSRRRNTLYWWNADTVVKLYIVSSAFTPLHAQMLTETLAAKTKLHTLALDIDTDNRLVVEAMARYLRSAESVTSLSLATNAVSLAGIEVLARAIDENGHLLNLAFCGCDKLDDIATRLPARTTGSGRIREVYFSQLEIRNDHLPRLQRLLDNCAHGTLLVLNRCRVSFRDLGALCSRIANSTNIDAVELYAPYMREDGVYRVDDQRCWFPLLDSSARMRSLIIDTGFPLKESMNAVFQQLYRHPTFKKVEFNVHPSSGFDISRCIERLLTDNDVLRHLSIGAECMNFRAASGLYGFSDALSSNTTLKSFQLTHSTFTHGMPTERALRIIRNNDTLRHLRVCFNCEADKYRPTDEESRAFGRALEGNTCMLGIGPKFGRFDRLCYTPYCEADRGVWDALNRNDRVRDVLKCNGRTKPDFVHAQVYRQRASAGHASLDGLPDELLCDIFQRCAPRDIVALCHVASRVRRVAEDHQVSNAVLLRHAPHAAVWIDKPHYLRMSAAKRHRAVWGLAKCAE